MSKKKAADGSGSIRQRPDGRWEARFTFTDELGQKKRRSVYGDTQKEVRQKLTTALKAVDEGTYRTTKRYTFRQWFNEWVATYGVDWKPRTADDYKSKAERHILPYLGEVQLAALSTVHIQKWVNQLSTGTGKQPPLSPKSVKNCHGILHGCLKYAVISRLIKTNPADYVKLPKTKVAKLSPLLDDDITTFMKACEHDRYGRLYIVDMFTGLRQSEILGLKWSDIDFDSGTIHVQRQLQKLQDKPEYIFLDTKNGKDRYVPFSPSIAALLKQEQRQQAIWKMAAGSAWDNHDDLVFTTETGNHLSHSTIQNNFRKLRNSLGFKCRFHDLRHSCATLAIQSGCDYKSISEMLGHYSVAFTMNRYSDVSKAMQRNTQSCMEEVFQSAANG